MADDDLGRDLGRKVTSVFLAAIVAIIVLSQFGVDTSWILDLTGKIIYNLFVDAIGAILAGAVGAVVGVIVGEVGFGAGIGAGVGAVITQILQWIFPFWIG